MTIRDTAEYGRWASPVSAQAATATTRSITSPRPSSSPAIPGFFLVAKNDGSSSSTIYSATVPPRQVLPDKWGVHTAVHEYGGLGYAVYDAGTKIVFSEVADNSCRVLDVPSGKVSLLVAGVPHVRYADFDSSHAAQRWILAVQQKQADAHADARSYIVIIHRRRRIVQRIHFGAAFYSHPRWRPVPGGQEPPRGQLGDYCWREWAVLPFDGITLRTSVVATPQTLAGRFYHGVGEAAWAPDGSCLVFSSEDAQETAAADKRIISRQLYRYTPISGNYDLTPVCLPLDGLHDAEFGRATWYLGGQSFAFLSPTTLVAVGTQHGKNFLVYVDITNGAWAPLDAGDNPLVEIGLDALAVLSPSSFLVVGSSFTAPQALYRVDLVDGQVTFTGTGAHVKHITTRYTQLYPSPDPSPDQAPDQAPNLALSPAVFSTPELITVAREDPLGSIHGWFWPPHTARFAAPSGTLPPLIVIPHGDPASHPAPGLHMMAQYWATRGFAYLSISGSSGHGWDHGDRLRARWSTVDTDDVAACVRHLTGQGDAPARVDSRRVGIRGTGAAGYNILQSLSHYPDLFAGGVCCCGVADPEALARDTHKLESRYLERLQFLLKRKKGGITGDASDTGDTDGKETDESPQFHADKITAPLRLIHGDEDTVVPIAQSRRIEQQIRECGRDVDLVVLEGEGHLFARADTKLRCLEAEAEWWEKTLLGDKAAY